MISVQQEIGRLEDQLADEDGADDFGTGKRYLQLLRSRGDQLRPELRRTSATEIRRVGARPGGDGAGTMALLGAFCAMSVRTVVVIVFTSRGDAVWPLLAGLGLLGSARQSGSSQTRV